MNISDILLNTPLGAIFIIVLLVMAAFAAWGAYANRPGAQLETASPTPPQRPTPEPPKKEVPNAAAIVSPEKKEPAPCICKDDEPCAEERREILRLSGELETAKAESGTKEGEIHDLTGRLAISNKKLEELGKLQPKPTKPQKVTVGNIVGLLANLGEINRKAADDLRNEAKKDELTNFDRVKNRLEQFATYLEQRGFERPDPGNLLKMLQDALKQ